MQSLGSAVLTQEITAERAVAAVVSREEIRRALDEQDASPELLLAVVREDERGEKEQDTIKIDWSRQDVEDLLARTSGDRVVLTFDRAQLEQALGDVEAHGLRERALVFAVAATGVLGAGAGIGHAMPAMTDVSSTGGYTASSTAATFLTDASSASGYASQAAAEDQMVSDASSASGYASQAAAEDSVVTDVSSGGGYAASGAIADSGSLVTDVSSAGGYAAPSPSSSADGGITFKAFSPATDAAIGGALVLTIAAAAFTARRRTPERTA
jgi:hypothetical protein